MLQPSTLAFIILAIATLLPFSYRYIGSIWPLFFQRISKNCREIWPELPVNHLLKWQVTRSGEQLGHSHDEAT